MPPSRALISRLFVSFRGKHFEKRARLRFLAQIEPIRQSCLPLSLRERAFSSFSPGRSQVFGEVLAPVKAICHNPCLLCASSDFWFLLSLFWHQILHCHRNGKWNQQSFCRINVVSQNGGINIPPVHRNSCHLVLFPPARVFAFTKNRIKIFKKIPPCLAKFLF